jgi:hypothetical protein
MNEPLKVKDGSQPYKIGLVIIAIALIAYFGFRVTGGNTLGQAIEFPKLTDATGTSVIVKNIPTRVLSAGSYGYFRLTNTASNTQYCVFTSSTAGFVAGAGIPINSSSTPGNYFDSGEANIGYPSEGITCITSVTGTMATFRK